MIYILFFLAQPDTIHPLNEKSESTAVLAAVDTVKKDTIIIYEIPEIVRLGQKNAVDSILGITQRVIPAAHDLNPGEAFFSTPFFLLKNGNSISLVDRAIDPVRTRVLFNGHTIDNDLTGYLNLYQVPVQCLEEITTARVAPLNFVSKVNHYDKPYSSINFSTLGNNTIYNIDFTRALTNDCGFYLDGLYSNAWSDQDSFYRKTNSFYTNLYYNRFLPMRFDFMFSSNSFGNEETDDFVTLSLVSGIGQYELGAHFNRSEMVPLDTLTGEYSRITENLGFNTETHSHTALFDYFADLHGAVSKTETGRGTSAKNRLELLLEADKSYRRFLASAGNGFILVNREQYFLAPHLTLGYVLLDSTYLDISFIGDIREPTITELYAPLDPMNTKGNQDLETGYLWSKEIGLERKNFQVNLYQTDYDDFIAVRQDTDGYYSAENIGHRSFFGTDGYIEVALCRSVSLGLSGNHLFSGEVEPYLPRTNARLSVMLKRETPRSLLGLIMRAYYIAERHGSNNNFLPVFKGLSLTGIIKFITLTTTLTMDNILDEDVDFYPMPRRNLRVSVKWDFWD